MYVCVASTSADKKNTLNLKVVTHRRVSQLGTQTWNPGTWKPSRSAPHPSGSKRLDPPRHMPLHLASTHLHSPPWPYAALPPRTPPTPGHRTRSQRTLHPFTRTPEGRAPIAVQLHGHLESEGSKKPGPFFVVGRGIKGLPYLNLGVIDYAHLKFSPGIF